MAELKLKMPQIEQFFMFSISALPPEGTFQTHFKHIFGISGHLVKKMSNRFLKDSLVVK